MTTLTPSGSIADDGLGMTALNDFSAAEPQLFRQVHEMTRLPIAIGRAGGHRFLIDFLDGRLCVVDRLNLHHKPFSVDLDRTRRALSRGDLLRRALGRNVHSVIDATAGFGGDAVHLARMGFDVIAIERCPIVAALLADALGRIRSERVRNSIRLVVADSADLLGQFHADAVYLDPMFATQARLKSLPRRAMVLARALAGDDRDADTLLNRSRALYARVVVKRPDKSEPLASGVHHHHAGKTVRYDVYLNHGTQRTGADATGPVCSTDTIGK